MGEACSKVSPSQLHKPQALGATRPKERMIRVESSASGEAGSGSGPTGEAGDADIHPRRNWASPMRGQNVRAHRFGFGGTPRSQFAISANQNNRLVTEEEPDEQDDSFEDNPQSKKPLHQGSKKLANRTTPRLLKKNSQEPQVLSFFKLRGADIELADPNSPDYGESLPNLGVNAKQASSRGSNGQNLQSVDSEHGRVHVQPRMPRHEEFRQSGSGGKEVSSRIIQTNQAIAPGVVSGSDLGVINGQRLHTHHSTNNSSSAGPTKQDSITHVEETPRKTSFEEGSQSRFSNVNGSKDVSKRVRDRSGRPIIKIGDDTSIHSNEVERGRGTSPMGGSKAPGELQPGISGSRRTIAVRGQNTATPRRKSPVSSARKQLAATDRDQQTAEPVSHITGTLSTGEPEGSFKVHKVPQNSAQNSRLAASSLQSSIMNGFVRPADMSTNTHLPDRQDLVRSKLPSDTDSAKLQPVSSNTLGNSRFLKSWIAEASNEKSSRIRPIEEEKSFIYHSIGSLEDFSDVLNSKWVPEQGQTSSNPNPFENT